MPTLREYLELEAIERLDGLVALVDDPGAGERILAELRALRGAARLADDDAAFHASAGLETAVRHLLLSGRIDEDPVHDRVLDAVRSLRDVFTAPDDADTDPLVAAVLQKCAALGDRTTSLEQAAPEPAAASDASAAFREFARTETASIARTVEEAIEAFVRNPMDREALKGILRRQRALLGAARLAEIEVLHETLHAIEDLSAVIAKINVPVKSEWLDVFRSSRDILRDAHERLNEAVEPRPINALSRLRTLRDELLERYGSAEAVSTAAPPGDGLVQALPADASAASAAVPPPTHHDRARIRPRPSGEELRQRAHELRERIEPALRPDAAAMGALEELFGLLDDLLS